MTVKLRTNFFVVSTRKQLVDEAPKSRFFVQLDFVCGLDSIPYLHVQIGRVHNRISGYVRCHKISYEDHQLRNSPEKRFTSRQNLRKQIMSSSPLS